jgi:predicted ATPase
LVPGQNSDYTLLVQYVDVSVDPVIDNHDTHVINYLRIKLNRNKITDSNALGFGNYGY